MKKRSKTWYSDKKPSPIPVELVKAIWLVGVVLVTFTTLLILISELVRMPS